ncbi:MAG TPA: amino acid adenylation domain-containing protein [Pyrinomonadaceae bacterium]|jgi:amino acid adenylation domain-containing protein|nr:amino acid adenylation domain-containing protein [Pyrinomonadaceae bacterium]
MSAVSDKKRELLARLLREEGLTAARGIERRGAADSYELSSAQQRLWFLEQFAPGCAAYNIPAAFRLTGRLDAEALRRSLAGVVRRHSVLRARFAAAGARPAQFVAPELDLQLQVTDLSGLDAGAREAEALRLIGEESRRPFDLARGPLVRAGLLRLGAEEHFLFLTLHHIVADGWSLGLLLKETAALYEAETTGRAAPLAELPVQYTDYAHWEQERLRGGALEGQLAYWRRHLAGAPPTLNLPTDRTRPAAQSFRGARLDFRLSAELSDALRSLSRREGCTLFMTLLAGFQSLLARYTGQHDIVVGTPAANRRLETEPLIGLFVNTLALRTDLSGDPTFRDVLARVREVTAEAHANQDVPFERLVEELQPERELSHSPLVQVMFAMQSAASLELPGLDASPADVHNGTAKFDLLLSMAEADGGLTGTLEYSTDLFDAATAERMLGHFRTLLEACAADPSRPLGALPMLTAPERRRLLVEWNDTAAPYPADTCVHELFERQAALTPDALALVFEGERLSYRELNERANRLARCLRRRGVGPDVMVGLMVERSAEMVVGVLAILKAGGAYLPLDPSYPAERLAFMLADSAAPVLLTQRHLRERCAGLDAEVLCLDADWEGNVAAESAESLPVNVGARNLAYVIYTSGSTGVPKGVQLPHGALNNLVNCMRRLCPLTGEDAWLAVTSLSFDIATLELFLPLVSGARIELVSRETAADGLALGRLVRARGATIMQATPATWRMMVEAGWEDAPGLRVISGGEALAPELARQLQARGCRVWNIYGPTETTIYSIGSQVEEGAQIVTIGRPLDNTQVYLLDPSMRPVPVGVVGEIYIGGAGLARGYLNRPALTAERFAPDPFSTEPGARLYRTGDLARFLPDGRVDYLGRADNQIKIRGHRIELGEVEAALDSHPSVLRSVVVARRDSPGDARLVAYVVAGEGARPEGAALRAYIQERLPAYMVPSAFVVLDSLPLTPNGKVDRKALPAPDWDGETAERVAPRTPVEEVLAGVWSQVLGVAEVSVNDNFFERGGHSLSATQLVARVREVFGVELPLRRLFESPTLADVAEAVAALLQQGQGPEDVPLEAGARDADAAPSFSQQRLWFLEQLTPGASAYNIAGALRLRGRLNAAALRQGLDEIVRRHEALRTTFRATADGRAAQVVAPRLALTLPLVSLEGLPAEAREAQVSRLAAEDARRPFDLARGPLLRCLLLRLDEREHVLMINAHHIISDGWSMSILARELTRLYGAFATGEPSPLAELPVQYADFAAWQRRRLQGPALESQLAYWRQRLGGAAPALELPTDRPRPPVQTFEGARQTLVLSPEATAALKSLGRGEGVTLFMTLLAGFGALLHRLTGQEDIVIGSPIAGRTRAEVENLIGFFVNTLALRTDLSGDPTFRDVLARARETALGAYAHQELPFENLLEALQPRRDLSRTPLFQVFLNLLNFEEGAFDLPELKVELLPLSEVEAKFDLTLYAAEEGGRLKLDLVYNAALFGRARAAQMLEQLGRMLADAARSPETKVSQLSLLTASSAEVLPDPSLPLRADWDGPVHEQFARRAARLPLHTAVADPHLTYTYSELDARANRVAHYLSARGVGREDVVAIYAHRSAPLAVALLGVLKAGASFVILDPAYPAARLRCYLELARPKGWIELEAAGRPDESLHEYAASLACRLTLPRTADGPDELDAYPADGLGGVAVGPEATAYFAFTSGSTGVPKCVVGPHGSLAHFAAWAASEFGVGNSDRFSVLSGLAHDPLHRDIFTPLQVGAAACFPDPEEMSIPGRLAAWMRRQQITVSNLTPAMGQVLTQEVAGADAPELPTLRRVFFIGDVLTRREVARLRRLAPAAAVVNLYGATETSRAVSHYVVPEFASEEEATAGRTDRGKEILPLGRGIAGVQLLVLNAAGGLAGVGEPGEIYFRSPHLAKGYLRDEALTRERFVTSPFTGDPADRLYRTGDLGRYLPDGNVEPLGRADQQVKIRGFRVELGEIEALLGQHPSVGENAVVAREDAPGEKRLVAYVVPAVEGAADAAELRRHLRERLPAYMVPSFFVTLEQLPLTPNGKLDRRALPAPERLAAAPGGDDAEPLSAAEEILAATWAEVLGVESVGRDDNFFDLGGHSLLALQVMARVSERLRVELPLRALFESPTVGELAGAVERARGTQPPAAPPVTPSPRGESQPLSFAQQRLWFLEQLQPDSGVYNIPGAVRLHGWLNAAALRQALNEIVRRHEALRTTFPAAGDQPSQVIAPSLVLDLPLTDLRHLPLDAAEAEARRLMASEGRRPFDLAAGPLVRARLLRLSQGEHILHVTIHHIVSDAWSLGVLVRELNELYAAAVEGRPTALAELPVQYADYAAWQRRRLQGEVLETQLAYWTRRLGGELPALELPTDMPRPAAQTFRGARLHFALPRELSAHLNLLCRREGVTPFMLFLTAFKVLLHRYTGQRDILVGTPVAGRTRRETEGLIGFFVNTLVMRSEVSGGESFRELLGRVRESALEAYAHQELPLERLVEELRLARDLSREALFQVMFVMQNTPPPAPALPGLTLEPLQTDNGTSKFDLLLSLAERGGAFEGYLEYSTDLFEEATAARALGHFETLLRGAASDPGLSVGELPLMTEGESRLLLAKWNATGADYDLDDFIHRRFERQAALTPDALALVFEGERLSYRELNERANRLAHRLRSQGVGPESLVGILMERSIEMVVAIYAILKAGSAYVPLEPSYPEERLAYVVEDARLGLVLTQERFAGRLGESPARVLVLDGEWAGESFSRANPAPTLEGDNLAYVIYTSGSTGRPKGAMNTHRAVCNRLLWMQDEYRLTPDDRVLQKTPFSFDVSVWEFFWPLMTGATLVVARPGGHQESAYLVGAINEHRITTIHFVPSMLQAFLEDPGLDSCVSLRRVICSGEALQYEQQERLLARLATGLHNLYGPTEAAIDVTFWECGGGERRVVPIGRPVANTQIYVLDAGLRPVPVGIAGELHIGGVQLARGYLNRPGLTAERFIPDPFSTEPGARMYKTGDRARYLPDGAVEYLGRLDNQVKLRGFRIELGEVEAALRQDARVRECVVVAREEAPGDARLVAYYVASGAAAPEAGELRESLKGKLPPYMVPSAFVALDSLPLTTSGKVDRKALPAPGAPEAAGGYTAPRGQLEEILADTMAGVLMLERVGADDNFFDLGGHSLLATTFLNRVRDTFGVAPPLRRLFETPTVAALAPLVEAALSGGDAEPLPPIEPAERGRGIPLSFAQERLWVLDQLTPGGHTYNEHTAIRLTGALNLPALEQSLGEIVRRHEVLRTTYATEGGRPVQNVTPARTLLLPLVDLSRLPRAESEAIVARLAAEEPRRPFDLRRGPVVRSSLLRLGEREHVLLLSLHHIAFDGWSNAVLVREAAALYESFAAGEPSPLAELPVQYADYAAWQRRSAEGEGMEPHLRYWRRQLDGPPPPLMLPTDREQEVRGAAGASLPVALPASLADDLKVLSRQERVTLFMTLMAAFKVLLHSYSGQLDLVVGTNVVNRGRSETEGLIGFFINLLALRTDLSGDPTFRELLAREREVTLKALAHQELPFAKLISDLKLDRGVHLTPLARALMQLQTAPRAALELPGLEQQFLDVGVAATPFELVLNLLDGEEGLVGSFLYSTEVFDAATVASMAERYALLLRTLPAKPDLRLRELVELLREDERRRLTRQREEFKSDRRAKLKQVKLQPVVLPD